MNNVTEITERVKTFEDACTVLGLDPANLPVVDCLPEKDRKSIIAFYKLTIIIRALNEGWEPDWTNWNQYKCYNWFYAHAGLGFAYSYRAPSSANTHVGSRLCFKTRELAIYAGDQFIDLYSDYLLIPNDCGK